MPESKFKSHLAPWFDRFLMEKRACGFAYVVQENRLRHFDRLLVSEGLTREELPKRLVELWTAKRPNEKSTNQQARAQVIHQFALFLSRQGVPAYIPNTRQISGNRSQFLPFIFTRKDVGMLLRAVDQIPYQYRSPLRHRTMPEIFRLLYGCGLRRNEPLALTVADVDLDQGILRIRQSKDKDRLVPMALSLKGRLQRYAESFGSRSDDAVFFPGPDGQRIGGYCVYRMFRMLLTAVGIQHRGRGQGPRLHDMRATFAVHRLETWYLQGADLRVKLPVLSTYMGHRNLFETQRYLRLTAELFPDIASRLEKSYGHIIPRIGETHEF